MSDEVPAWTRREIALRIEQIANLFKPGAKLTIVVRNHDDPEQDFVMGNDTMEGAIAALERSKTRKPK